MSNSNFILTYWRKEQTEFNKNFEILRQHPNKNAVHDLRVAIKKLRACLKLFAVIADKKDPIATGWKDHFQKTKELFSILGKERDTDMSLELIAGYKKETGADCSSLTNAMQKQLKTSQGWSHLAIKKYSKIELTKITSLLRKDTSLSSDREVIKKIIKAINTQLQQIKKYYKLPHKIRKLLKDVYYWLKMLPEGAVSGSSFEKKLNKMLDDFGNWQNDEMLLAKVKHFRKDWLPSPLPEYETIRTLEKKIKNKQDKILKEVLLKTRRLPKEISASDIKK